MARSALFAALRRAAALARAPDPEARLEAEARLGRRAALAAGAAGLAGLAGCRGPEPARSQLAPRILIVGGGLAGLTCAYRLARCGYRATVLEARDRVGGRTCSVRDHFGAGRVAELGGEFVNTDHTHLRRLAEELGVGLEDYGPIDRARPHTYWFGGRARTLKEVATAFRPLAAQVRRDAKRLPDHVDRTTRQVADLDRRSLAEYLEGLELDDWFRRLIEVAYTNEYGREPGEQTCLNLLWMIDPRPEPFRIYGESDQRYHLAGGSDQVARRLRVRLGEQVVLGARLERLRQDAAGRFVLSLQEGGRSRERIADHVVLALPFSVLRRLRLDVDLPPLKRRAIAELGYGENAKLILGFERRVWRARHGANGGVFTDLPFRETWETDRAHAGAAGILTNFVGGLPGRGLGEGDVAGRAEAFLRDLARPFPGVAEARSAATALRAHWPSDPLSRGSYSCYRPGQVTSFGGAEGESVGRLHFAGEHCSFAHQGYMEGAVETGERAAFRIRLELGARAN